MPLVCSVGGMGGLSFFCYIEANHIVIEGTSSLIAH